MKEFKCLFLTFFCLLLILSCDYQIYNPFNESFYKNNSDDNSLHIGSNLYSFITTVDNAGGYSTSIAVDGSNLYVSYYDDVNFDLKFARSTDGGLTWPTVQTIDLTGQVGYNTSIAVDGSSVYISYYDYTNGNLKFAKSSNGGDTWPTIQAADSTGDVGDLSAIAVDGLNVYISYFNWSTFDLKFAGSTDGGATWPNIQTIDSTGWVGYGTSIAVEGSNVYISYFDNTNNYLKFAKSTDSGVTWLPGDIKIVDSTGNAGSYHSIAANGSNVYISYYDAFNGYLKFARSTDGGDTWPTIQTIDSTGWVGAHNSITVSGSSIYISYSDWTNNDLKFARSTDGGLTWPAGNIKTVDSAGNVGATTSIAVDGSNIYISYVDTTNNDIKFAKSVDGGVTW